MKITAKKLLGRMSVVDENILAEAAGQPLFFVDLARYRVGKMRLRLKAKAAMEAYEAYLGLKIRAKSQASGDKTTEKGIEARIQGDTKYQRLRGEYDSADASEEFSKLLLDCGRMRRDAIRIIAEAQHIEGSREGAEVQRIETRRGLLDKVRKLEDRRARLRGEE